MIGEFGLGLVLSENYFSFRRFIFCFMTFFFIGNISHIFVGGITFECFKLFCSGTYIGTVKLRMTIGFSCLCKVLWEQFGRPQRSSWHPTTIDSCYIHFFFWQLGEWFHNYHHSATDRLSDFPPSLLYFNQ